MMNTLLHLWAFREIIRRPFESLLLSAALMAGVVVAGTLLLLPRALYDTVEKLLSVSPSIVVRRIGVAGWQPIPIEEAIYAVKDVVGVVSATPRIWGVAAGPDGRPVTVVGIQSQNDRSPYENYIKKWLQSGEAIIGAYLDSGHPMKTIRLNSAISRDYRVIDRFPVKSGMFTHDLVLLNFHDAQSLMGLSEAYASDLAIEVFHEDEEEGILPDLAAAFPWAVRCTTRSESAGIYAKDMNRGGSIIAVALIPAVLSVCLLVVVDLRRFLGNKRELGIMKAMGWATGDIIRLKLHRVISICLPSVAMGLWICFYLVYSPGVTWIGRIFLGWDTMPPALYLDPAGAISILLSVAGLFLAPVIGSAMLPAIMGVNLDVISMIEEISDHQQI